MIRKKTKRYIPLNSVGCFLDRISGYTFAMLDIKDSYCTDSAIHLADCSEEWLQSLNKKDKKIVDQYIKKFKEKLYNN